MNNSEFSSQFDILYNNVTSNQAPGLNEAEKSVFLTKAEKQLVVETFNPRVDGVGGGFDGSQKRQYDFSKIIKTAKLAEITSSVSEDNILDRRSKVYAFPDDYFLAVNEIIADNKYQYSVLPIDYAEYSRLMLKPYNFPVKRGVWRIFTGKKNVSDANLCVRVFPFGEKPSVLTGWTSETSYVVDEYVSVSSIPIDEYYGEFELTPFWSNGTINSRLAIAIKVEENNEKSICVCVDSTKSDNLTTDAIAFTYIQSYLKNNLDTLSENFLLLYNLLNRNTFYPIIKEEDTYSILSISDWTMVPVSTEAEMKFSPQTKIVIYEQREPKENSGKSGYIARSCVLAEIIGKFIGTLTYKLRYVKTLKPIILDDLTNYGEDFTIDGLSAPTECELPEETHQEILERAVTLAKIAWAGGTATQVAAQSNRESR